MSTSHSKAAARFLKNGTQAQWHNETLWMVRAKRDNLAMKIPQWEELREQSSQWKMEVIAHWETYLSQFIGKAEANGVIVHRAKDAGEHNRIVLEILQQHGVKKLVKSKSMLTEECHLNDFLIGKGIEVIESDLGERILQLMNQPPSHIVMPAIHLKRQEVGKLFEKEWHTESGNSDPTYLTHAARMQLRNEFLTADAAMTGANFGVADTGDVVVCTNEGNADMGTSFAPLHIVSMGLEKVIPNNEALSVFTRLLARSATGQPVTTYISHYRKPREGGEMHIVLVDNGRTAIANNPDHIQTLKCLRCGACMNTCPVYRRSGGYAYSYFIPGPIGINLGMLQNPQENAGNLSACSLCYSCNNVCPAKIDLADQIYRWRQQLDSLKRANPAKKRLSGGMKFLFNHPALYRTALKMAPLLNILPRPLIYNKLNDWGKEREMPQFASKTFTQMWEKNEVQQPLPDESEGKSHIHPVITTPLEEKIPSPTHLPLTFDDKIAQFIEVMASVGGRAVELQEGETLEEAIHTLYPDARTIASNLPEITTATFNPDEVATPHELNGTDLAIIRGELGVAENASVWIPQNVRHKALYFVSEQLLILLDKKKLVNNMHEAYRQIGMREAGFGVFISGPSKTADIEQALVVGAHGARAVAVLLS